MSKLIEHFCRYYQELSLDSLSELSRIYDQNAVFEDPIHSIQGLDTIATYFGQLIENVTYCRFQVNDAVETEEQAYVTWVMTFAHPKLNNDSEIKLAGSSHLKFNDRIFYQRDYYDLGHMIYEQIPLLGFVISKIKKRMMS